MPQPEPSARPWWLAPRLRWAGGILLLLLLCLILLAGLLPVGWAKERIAHKLAEDIGAPVTIGSLSREPVFSFSPTVVARDVRIAQPAWAGKGDLVRVRELRVRVHPLSAAIGRGLRPDRIEARGLVANLVRDAQRRNNWGGRKEGGGGGRGTGLNDLVIPDGRFTLRDARRHLDIAGTLTADARGVAVHARGRFHESDATLSLTGPAIIGRTGQQSYPFQLAIASPLLDLRASGTTVGALNIANMDLDMTARGPSLKYLDDIIQAGLFGTQPIDLRAHLRHRGRDWFVDRLAGTVGRSALVGKAEILKRDGRSKIDATLDFSTFDFDDLADDQGRAEHAALAARIGPRVLPNTRINLAKIGPTDGQIRFTARRLLFRNPSVFRSLKGVIRLEGKLLTVDQIEAGLTNGRMTGKVVVDHRTGAAPRLDLTLRYADGRLGALLGAADKVDAPFGALVRLAGRGDTIREALGRSDGKVGLVARNGNVSRLVASVLGQDMGKTIGAAIDGGNDSVALNCVALGFDARGGKLAASPFLIDTAVARSRGTGTIDLDGERIALVIGGQARHASGLAIIDPIRIGGTMSAPTLELSGIGSGKKDAGTILGAVAKSLGGALGLNEKKGPAVSATGPIDCAALSRGLLGGTR